MPAITSNTLRETIATYTREYVYRQYLEVLAEPLTGHNDINPGENFTITLRATNDPDFTNPAGADPAGIRLVNVRWHVSVIGGANAPVQIEVPDEPLDAREGPSDNLPLLTPGDTVSELYVFPRHGKRVLDPGETNEITLQGWAPGPDVGNFTLGFDIIADVDPDHLTLEEQVSYSDTVGALVVT